MAADLMQLLGMLGGQSTPPAMGGPQPPQGMPYPLGAQGGNQNALAALAGIGMMQMMSETRKLTKAQNTVGMSLPKPTQTSPMAGGIGQADLQQRGAQVAGQASPQAMMPGAMGPRPGMPPQMAQAQQSPGAMMSMLAQRGMM